MENETFDFTVLIEQDEDGIYIAKIPEIQGCYTQGKSVEEALSRIKEAAEVCIEGDKEEFAPLKFIGIQKVQIGKPKVLN